MKERSIFRTGEDSSNPGLGRPTAPPSRFFDRLISAKLGRNHSAEGTEPVRRLPERSNVRRRVMFLRYFHEMAPLRFLEERRISEKEQLNSEEALKPETEANALRRSAWSEELLHVEDSDRERRETRSRNLKSMVLSVLIFMVFTL